MRGRASNDVPVAIRELAVVVWVNDDPKHGPPTASSASMPQAQDARKRSMASPNSVAATKHWGWATGLVGYVYEFEAVD